MVGDSMALGVRLIPESFDVLATTEINIEKRMCIYKFLLVVGPSVAVGGEGVPIIKTMVEIVMLQKIMAYILSQLENCTHWLS